MQQKFTLSVLDVRTETKVWQDSFLMRAVFLACRWLPSHCLCMVDREQALRLSSYTLILLD